MKRFRIDFKAEIHMSVYVIAETLAEAKEKADQELYEERNEGFFGCPQDSLRRFWNDLDFQLVYGEEEPEDEEG